jgi:Kef-type K+ transport system membrane component KefB
MLLLEAGVELDVAQLNETGLQAIAIGCTSTILPILLLAWVWVWPPVQMFL